VRGLFSARVLERFEVAAGLPASRCFDLVVGTSMGGVLAIGLACGVPAAEMRSAIEAQCATIFRRRWERAAGFLGARYDPGHLGTTISSILGPWAARPFADIPRPVAVVAVDEAAGTPKVFRSDALGRRSAGEATVLDAALATSAAPTYFPPHVIGERAYVDGGLVANAPDLVAITEAIRAFGVELDELLVLAVGTAGSARAGRLRGDPGVLGWLVRHRLFDLTIDAQARLAAAQLDDLGVKVLRIETPPRKPIGLDDTGPATRAELVDLANGAFDEAHANHRDLLRRFAAHRAA
jgi:patatin-like phospholipase/acyl hydrolase